MDGHGYLKAAIRRTFRVARGAGDRIDGQKEMVRVMEAQDLRTARGSRLSGVERMCAEAPAPFSGTQEAVDFNGNIPSRGKEDSIGERMGREPRPHIAGGGVG